MNVKVIFTLLLMVSMYFGCTKSDKNHSCYDESLVHNNFCTADCPGFEGCDGQTYCNECEAARVGIGPN